MGGRAWRSPLPPPRSARRAADRLARRRPSRAGATTAPAIEAAAFAATGATFTVQRPDDMNNDDTATYWLQAYSDSDGSTAVGALLQAAKAAGSGATGANGDEFKFSLAWPGTVARVYFGATAKVGARTSPRSALSSQIVVGGEQAGAGCC